MNRFKTDEERAKEMTEFVNKQNHTHWATLRAIKYLDKVSPLRATNIGCLSYDKADFCEVYELVMLHIEAPDRRTHEDAENYSQMKEPYNYTRKEFKPISRRTKW